MRRRTNCSKPSIPWLQVLALIAGVSGGLALGGVAGATPIHRVGPLTPRHPGLASVAAPAVYSHSFLTPGPLAGDVMPVRQAPKGLAAGWHRHHDGGTVTLAVFHPPKPLADDTTSDSTGPAIPEPSAALLFGAGSLLVANALQRRKAAA